MISITSEDVQRLEAERLRLPPAQMFAAWKATKAADDARRRRQETLIRELVHVLAEAMGVSP
jgi:hypothetical protein